MLTKEELTSLKELLSRIAKIGQYWQDNTMTLIGRIETVLADMVEEETPTTPVAPTEPVAPIVETPVTPEVSAEPVAPEAAPVVETPDEDVTEPVNETPEVNPEVSAEGTND